MDRRRRRQKERERERRWQAAKGRQKREENKNVFCVGRVCMCAGWHGMKERERERDNSQFIFPRASFNIMLICWYVLQVHPFALPVGWLKSHNLFKI
jgi:hypothetical protein